MEKFNFDQFDDQRYRLSYMLQDALIVLTPILLTLLGVLFLG
ncbi:MAG TPA: hypothetical protein VIW47_03160 [Nitrospiraceae bacterium]|jgi:hypothetical protein